MTAVTLLLLVCGAWAPGRGGGDAAALSDRVAVLIADPKVEAYTYIADELTRSLQARGVAAEAFSARNLDRAALIAFRPALIVAVGTQAVTLAPTVVPERARWIYCGVSSLPGKQDEVPGVLLQVDPAYKVGVLKRAFPDVQTVGAVFDPKKSGELV